MSGPIVLGNKHICLFRDGAGQSLRVAGNQEASWQPGSPEVGLYTAEKGKVSCNSSGDGKYPHVKYEKMSLKHALQADFTYSWQLHRDDDEDFHLPSVTESESRRSEHLATPTLFSHAHWGSKNHTDKWQFSAC